MRNSAGIAPGVTFRTDYLAGTTTIERGESEHIYRPAGMDGWVINCTTMGQGSINRGSQRFSCSQGDILLWPPGVAHDYGRLESEAVWVHRWMYFFARPSWEPWLRWPQVSGGVLRVSIDDRGEWERVSQRLGDVVALQERSSMLIDRELAMNALEEIVLICARRLDSWGAIVGDPRIVAVVEFIHAHYDSAIDIAQLAQIAALSPSRFAHLFTAVQGIAPQRFLERFRIQVAQRLLLESATPVRRIAAAVGFENPLYFSHVFRRVTGRSPRAFRTRGL